VTVAGLLVLASEGPANPNLWNPTILGVLVTISALGLFCGSVYLLLATNLGARLGFLVAAATLMGFMVLLSMLWWTSGNSGIDPPHGRSPSWKVVEVVSDPQESTVSNVQNIAEDGAVVPVEGLANLRPAMDAALVTATAVEGEEAPEQPLAQFGAALDYLTEFEGYQAWMIGGESKNLFWHEPKYAVVEFCPKDPNTPIGEAPKCDPLEDRQFAVLSFDYGSLRQPVVFQFLIPSILLFGLSLLGLHWYELDNRKRKRERELAPVPSSEG
jgi:hypothetical protein